MQISPAQRAELSARFQLDEAPAADVGSEPAILASLEACNLSRWTMLGEAIPGRFHSALAEAARLLEPKAVAVRLPGGTLHNEAELDEWLQRTGTLLREKLGRGAPVIIS